jgi:hypothetical protein
MSSDGPAHRVQSAVVEYGYPQGHLGHLNSDEEVIPSKRNSVNIHVNSLDRQRSITSKSSARKRGTTSQELMVSLGHTMMLLCCKSLPSA